MTVDDKTLDLIGKLHALATNKGATEAEAANAMAKMQALLFKHNISIEDVNLNPQQRKAGIGEEDISVDSMTRAWFGNRIIRKNERQWMITLADVTAKYNFCRTMVTRDNTYLWFVGTPENIAAVKTIWVFMCEQVRDLAESGFKVSGSKTDHRVWKRNFSLGCVARLDARLREQWEILQQQHVESRALIVVNDTDLTEYIEARTTKTTSRRAVGKSRSGYAEGYVAGERVSLTGGRKEIV